MRILQNEDTTIKVFAWLEKELIFFRQVYISRTDYSLYPLVPL